MTKEREALKLALAAVKNRDSFLKWYDLQKAIEEALAQPERKETKCDCVQDVGQCSAGCLQKTQPKEQEPVSVSELKRLADAVELRIESIADRIVIADKLRKLAYTTPPQRTWVGLTDEEIMDVAFNFDVPSISLRTIEAKLKEKNT